MFFKFLDWLLDQPTKHLINQKVMSFWSFIDDLQRLPFLQRIREPKFQMYIRISIFVLTLSAVLFIVHGFAEILADGTIGMVLALLIGCIVSFGISWISIKILQRTARSSTISVYLAKTAPIFLIGLVGVVTLYMWFAGQPEPEINWQAVFSNSNPIPSRSMADTLISEAMVAILAVILTIAILFWPLSVLAILSISLIAFALYVSEFIIRRIAEQDKGAIIGFSVVVGGVGAALKIFSS